MKQRVESEEISQRKVLNVGLQVQCFVSSLKVGKLSA